MKQKFTPLVDEHLESVRGMQDADTDEFFYSRLKAKMENRYSGEEQLGQTKSKFMLKPVWVIGLLIVLLGLNGYMLSQQSKTKHLSGSASSSLQGFAQSYDQTISSYQ